METRSGIELKRVHDFTNPTSKEVLRSFEGMPSSARANVNIIDGSTKPYASRRGIVVGLHVVHPANCPPTVPIPNLSNNLAWRTEITKMDCVFYFRYQDLFSSVELQEANKAQPELDGIFWASEDTSFISGQTQAVALKFQLAT